MHDLDKINSTSIFALWKNLSVGLLVVLLAMIVSQLLSYLFSPIIALICAAVLYTILYNSKVSKSNNCMIVIYSLFYCMVSYSLLSIIINVLYIWGVVPLPKELCFFSAPYIPSLLMDPVCAVTLMIMYTRINSLSICMDCKLQNGPAIDRGRLGGILHRESRIQMMNLIILFTVLSVVVWLYYSFMYDKSTGLNNRDSYVMSTLNVICIVIDELYFAIRYYNLYLDLKENDDIISEEELGNMTTKTYLRFYVICDNSIYVNAKTFDPEMTFRHIIDTPYVTKRNVNGITTMEVETIIRNMVKVPGHLRFFYGRKNPDLDKHSLLRYFYFIDGNPKDYNDMRIEGEWMDFNRIKNIYNQSPTLLSRTMLSDISRMSTVVLTQKIFNDNGVRKVKVRSYVPSFDLHDIRNNDYDFQDDKWIKIAMFNSDTKGFFFRKMFSKVMGRKKEDKTTWQKKG